MSKLEVRAHPNGEDWCAVNDRHNRVATFHRLSHEGDEARRNAEAFVESQRIIRELRSAVEQLIESYELLHNTTMRANEAKQVVAAFIFTPEQYRQQIEKIIGEQNETAGEISQNAETHLQVRDCSKRRACQ